MIWKGSTLPELSVWNRVDELLNGDITTGSVSVKCGEKLVIWLPQPYSLSSVRQMRTPLKDGLQISLAGRIPIPLHC